LRDHLSRWREHAPSDVQEIDLGGTYNGLGLTHDSFDPVFSDGVLAHWSAISVNSYLPIRLDLAQLPSPSKGTKLKEWHIIEPMIPVKRYWFEPKYDLLILLGTKDLPQGA
jgi:hypothetical protein